MAKMNLDFILAPDSASSTRPDARSSRAKPSSQFDLDYIAPQARVEGSAETASLRTRALHDPFRAVPPLSQSPSQRHPLPQRPPPLQRHPPQPPPQPSSPSSSSSRAPSAKDASSSRPNFKSRRARAAAAASSSSGGILRSSGGAAGMTPTGDAKPHTCASCERSFYKLEQLKRHERLVHLNYRPFVCSTCDLSFGTKQNMQVHFTTRKHQHRLEALQAAHRTTSQPVYSSKPPPKV